MEKFEIKKSRVEDAEFLNKFFDVYANELEDMVTRPGSGFSEEELEMVSRFRETRKLPKENTSFHDRLVKVGQDFRLTPDEIDVILGKFLE